MRKQASTNNLTKIILGALAIILIAYLPYLLASKFKAQTALIINKLNSQSKQNPSGLHQAMWWHKLANNLVQCDLCPNNCRLKPGQTGLCRARKNINGQLYSLNYGRAVAVHIDPIEKKPFFHFLPGAKAYSLAAAGCNLRCQYCQNWDISQVSPLDIKTPYQPPAEIIAQAEQAGAPVIAFTYSEPVVFYEYILDIARLAHQRGLKTVMVSSGYINPQPLKELLPYLDGIKIDLKAFDDKFYQKITKGHLSPVLNTLKIIHQAHKHLEIVYLLIPGENDSPAEISKMSRWLKQNLGAEAILHFSRFYPQYKMLNKPPTPVATVKEARRLALAAGLKYVYTGNIADAEGQTTYCPDGSIAIKRRGFFVVENNLKNGRCPDGTLIPGVWSLKAK